VEPLKKRVGGASAPGSLGPLRGGIADGSEDWVRSSPTVAESAVFVGSDSSDLYALEVSDGGWR
jgi:outer membrane protein assembly factor BamB